MSYVKEIENAVDAFLAEQGIAYAANFVPSATLGPNSDEHENRIGWRVTFSRNAGVRKFTTEFYQGIGHAPALANTHYLRRTASVSTVLRTLERAAIDEGKGLPSNMDFAAALKLLDSWDGESNLKSKLVALPTPSAASVLYCLVSDAAALDYPSFEDWADDFGYDNDSRKAERVYQACVQIGRDMNRVIGRQDIDQLRELMQDY